MQIINRLKKLVFKYPVFFRIESLDKTYKNIKVLINTRKIKQSGLFNRKYYLASNPELKTIKINPVRHYLLYGGFFGRNPSASFDSKFYLDFYPDVSKSGMNPLLHYILHGRSEGRLTSRPSYIQQEPVSEIRPESLKSLQKMSGTILFISHDALLAGAQVLLLSLIRWFSMHTGYTIKIICLRGGALLNEFKNLGPVIVWDDIRETFPSEEQRRNLMNGFCGKVDLIYGSTVISPSIYGELSFLKAPVITHIHELEKSIKTVANEETLKQMYRFTTGYISCTKMVADNLVRNHRIDPSKNTIINDFIDAETIPDGKLTKKERRKKLSLAEDKFLVFGCGSADWRKGTDLFIEAAKKLFEQGVSDFHFYWIGPITWDFNIQTASMTSVRWKDLEEIIKKAKIEEHITFLGEKENIRDYFRAGDVFLLPSREDPFPLVSLLAAECEIPVLCFEDAGGMPEFIGTDAGFVVPYGDAGAMAEKIRALMNEPVLVSRLGRTGREKLLLKHTTEITAPKILEYCRHIAGLKPFVSVIVPNYNYSAYLKKRLDSILEQTFKDSEIIILDDASTDNSREIINSCSNLPSVRTIFNKTNSGNAFSQWKKGFEMSAGSFLWFAEADDFCDPAFLENILPCFADENVVLAYSNSATVDEQGNITGDYRDYLKDLDPVHWRSSYSIGATDEINFGLGVKNSIPNASAVVFRKEDLKADVLDAAREYKLSGDWFIYVQVIKERKIAFERTTLNWHRKHGRTVTREIHTGDQNKLTLLTEAAKIHATVLENYRLDSCYIKKWDKYIEAQILALFPSAERRNYDNYYPYTRIRALIRNSVKNKKPSGKLAVIVSHAADRTGAPYIILNIAKNLSEKNGFKCISFILSDGELFTEFKRCGEAYLVDGSMIRERGMSISDYLQKLETTPLFAIVNTACCGDLMPGLKTGLFPVITLIHDYTYAFPQSSLRNIYELSDHIVYSSQFMLDKNHNDYRFDLNKTSVLPQGLYRTELADTDYRKKLGQKARKEMGISEDAFVIMGNGFLHPRKGVDIFIDTAIQLLSASKREIHFMWVGGELRSDSPDMYVRFLSRDVIHSGYSDFIHFVGPVGDVRYHMSVADLFFLSSREDPFPSVVLEAFASAIPVLGIEGCSGITELILKTGNYVVPFRKRGEIAMIISGLMDKKKELAAAGEKGRAAVLSDYNFDEYVTKIQNLLTRL